MKTEPINTVDALLEENRVFKPEKSFLSQANVKDAGIYKDAQKNPKNTGRIGLNSSIGFKNGIKSLNGNRLLPNGLSGES